MFVDTDLECGTLDMDRSVRVVPSRETQLAAPALAGGGARMKKSKDLNGCVSILLDTRRRNDLVPEQRKDVDQALGEVRKLGRLSHPTRVEVNRRVRRLTEALIRAFFK